MFLERSAPVEKSFLCVGTKQRKNYYFENTFLSEIKSAMPEKNVVSNRVCQSVISLYEEPFQQPNTLPCADCYIDSFFFEKQQLL